MSSANDAVVALAEKTYGSVESFIDAMNKKVNEIGLKNTSFKNVHGLDEDGHYSSSYDMAMIAKELLKYEDILKYTSVYEEYLKKSDGSQLWLVNTNKLVRFYKGVDGLKTGYTKNAGYCLTSAPIAFEIAIRVALAPAAPETSPTPRALNMKESICDSMI